MKALPKPQRRAGSDLAATLERPRRRLVAVAKRLDDLLDDVDAIARDLEDLAKRVPAGSASPGISRRRANRSPEEERLMRVEARDGVSLTIERNADGSAEVSLNGRQPFELRPQLATLLDLLVAPAGGESGGQPAWHTKEELAAALSKRTGGTVEPHTIAKLIHRLRDTLVRVGENFRLLLTDRRLGAWRLAVRR